MPSSFLAWVDHDAKARERSLRILSLFQERESRDELGLGAIRDSIADQLFPGTSTIQTRLRYFLFIPWIYCGLERSVQGGADQSRFGARAREAELNLIGALLKNEDTAGVFGVQAGRNLKRLPSSVYWAGLGSWGIRLFPGSIEEYHGAIGTLCARHDQRRHFKGEDPEPDTLALTWRPQIPDPPGGFPQEASLALPRGEALFLRDRIMDAHPGSLLALLASRVRRTDVDFPWEHPDLASFGDGHRALLDHGRRLSAVMHGAAILYNVLLAKQANLPDLLEKHRQSYLDWAEGQDPTLVVDWPLGEFWSLVLEHGHRITPATQGFVANWAALVRGGARRLLDDEDAKTLIVEREKWLKQAHSRFRNERALKQWGGSAFLGRLSFRWRSVHVLLNDLYDGLERA